MGYKIETTDGLIRFTLHDVVSSEDFARVAEEVRAIEARLEVTPDRITDMTEVTGMNVDFGSVESFAENRRKAVLKNKVKSAIIAPQALHFGFARMFQTLNDNPSIEIKIFVNPLEAWQWLGREAVKTS